MNVKPSYDLASLFFSIGCLPLLFLPFLPSIKFWYFCSFVLIVISLLNCIFNKNKFVRFNICIIGFLLIGFLWSTHSASGYLNSIEKYIDQKMIIKAEVKNVNISDNNVESSYDVKYILFNIKEINNSPLKKSFNISLLWKDKTTPSSGQIWQLKIKSKIVHTYLNKGSFDSQRFAIANRRLLTGNIEQAILVNEKINVRQKLRLFQILCKSEFSLF